MDAVCLRYQVKTSYRGWGKIKAPNPKEKSDVRKSIAFFIAVFPGSMRIDTATVLFEDFFVALCNERVGFANVATVLTYLTVVDGAGSQEVEDRV